MPASRNSQNDPNRFRSKGYVATSAAEYSAHQAALAAEKRLGQIKANTAQAIGAINAQNYADSDVKRKALAEQQAQQARANEGMQKLQKAKASGASAQEIKRLHEKYTVSEQTLKQQRVSRSMAASVTAARKAAESKVQRPQPITPSVYIQREGTTTNPIKGSQPDRSLVSPYLKNATRVTVTSPDGTERTFKDMNTAKKYIERTEGAEVQAPAGSLDAIYGQRSEEFNGVIGDLAYTYGQPQHTPLGGATENALSEIDKFILYKPEDPTTRALKTVLDPFAGFAKASLTTFASFGNLGTQAGALVKGREPRNAMIKMPQTFLGTVTDNLLGGKPAKQQFESAYAYVQSRGVPSVIGELGEIAIGGKGVPKAVAKVLPIKGSRYAQEGVQVTQTVAKGKTAIRTPAITTKTVGITSYELGYGTKKVPIISKVGEKINIGKPRLENVSVEVTPVTGKQIQRGVKLAADSTQFEQKINTRLIRNIGALPKGEKEKAEVIEEIIQITTKPGTDTPTAKALGSNAFSSITSTEQPSFVSALSKAQKKLINPIGTYEGSLSQHYFVRPQYLRKAGDVDLHASSYPKAAKQVTSIVPKMKADKGRSFFAVTSEKTRSAKAFVTDKSTGKKEKFLEILNPEETDESGILQSIEGSTLFGQKIPSKTYKVLEGKTYGRQRQILKKGESLYSIQKTSQGLKLEPAPFRKEKDVADFYALVESARVTEFAEGSKESVRLKQLLGKFEKSYGFDIKEYLAKNRVEPVTLSTERSALQRTGSTSLLAGSESARQGAPFGKSIPTSERPKTPEIRSVDTRSIPRSASQSIASIRKSIGSFRKSARSVSSSTTAKSAGAFAPKLPSLSGRSLSQGRNKSLPVGRSSGLQKSQPSMTPKSVASAIYGTSPPSASSPPKGGGSVPRFRSVSRSGKTISFNIPRRAIMPIIPMRFKNKTDRQKPKRYESHDFLGNTNVADIIGFRTTKKDIDVGDTFTAKEYESNILKSMKTVKKKRSKKSKKKKKMTLKRFLKY